MNARLLFILLIASVLLAFTAKFRRVGVVLSVVLLLLLSWFNIAPPTGVRGAKSPSASSSNSLSSKSSPVINLSADTVKLIDMQLSGSGAPWQLTGRAHNANIELVIRAFTLRFTRLDCPTITAVAEDCTRNWQGEHTVRLQLAPAATQKVDEAIWSHEAVPRLKGVARVDIVVLNVQTGPAS
jgi:hypothetical protein